MNHHTQPQKWGSFYKTIIVAIDSDSSDGSRQNKYKTSWKGFTILDVVKNVHGSWEEKVTTDVETAGDLEVEAMPDNVTELLHSPDKTSMDEKLLMDK